jgi:hypothetical protein
MKHFAQLLVLTIIAYAGYSHADSVDTASCGAMKMLDQCRITWNFSSRSDSFYSVQQFNPQGANWRTIATLPLSASNRGVLETPVEGGYLYRVQACDDEAAAVNCSGSTVVWAPFVQPESQVHLIPSRVSLTKWETITGKPMYAAVDKNIGWLEQVIQYNVYQMLNAIARTNVADLPVMTPVKDIEVELPSDPIEQVHYNVYVVYMAERDKAIGSKAH